MSTFEWISLIGILISGFWLLANKLTKIETTLVGKVSYEDCSRKREHCPCVREMNQIKEEMKK